jgi:RNA recognition motif-containing protein
MTDPRTGMTRGYGFVRFLDPIDQQRALNEMQGYCIGARPIRVSLATPKTKSPSLPPVTLTTTVFVGGLLSSVREDELRQYFQPFGDIVHVKIPPNKGCGFVQYLHRSAAELAIQRMNGFQIGNSRIRLSWGRSQNNKQPMSPLSSMPPSLPISPSSSTSVLSPLSSCSIDTTPLQK